MQLTLKPTAQVDTINRNVQARIWEGQTEDGTPVKAWICALQAQFNELNALAKFEAELEQIRTTRSLVSFDVKMLD